MARNLHIIEDIYSDIALKFHLPHNFDFAIGENDRKNVKSTVSFLISQGLEVYISGDISKNILKGEFPQGKYLHESFYIPYSEINLIAAGSNYREISDKIDRDLLTEEGKPSNLALRLFGEDFIGVCPTPREQIGNNNISYSYRFSWSNKNISKKFLTSFPTEIVVGITDKLE